MKTTAYRLIELFVIFVLAPISLATELSFRVKIVIAVIGFLYILGVMAKVERIKINIKKNINWNQFWKLTVFKLFGIALITGLYVFVMDSENLFNVVRSNYKVWLLFLFIYCVFSVYPQELIYRTFFFKRYKDLFKSKPLFIVLNAILFSLAHLFFRNTIVMVLTFLGGILFALTFNKTNSTLLVSIEHAIYGGWLYTVGMGEMLGFPT